MGFVDSRQWGMDMDAMDSGRWMMWKVRISFWVVLCCMQAPSYAEFDTVYAKYGEKELVNRESHAADSLPQSMPQAVKGSSLPMLDCYQETQLAIYQSGYSDQKIQLPVRVNLLNDWVSLRFQSATSKTSAPKALEVEQVQLSKLWRKPKDFIATEKLAKRCLLEK